ncbi:aminoacyl-tRNA hydrolase [Candidatus Parcubacteria bacterium]|jgi:peptidyl-tRNA hydrolase, PTH1 family|nr:aminoacyl-tRNA hydrolase [Candidatus Parcubacteria bacterium]
MRLIIGLGNPDKEHMFTRHNFGHLSIDSLVAKKELHWKKHKNTHSLSTDFQNGREKIVLAKSMTYMNDSGKAVRALKKFYKLPTNKIIVIYDDIDLPYGKIRLSKKRGAGGHRGVESIIKHLKSKDFKRIRLGIGPQKGKAESFVLKRFSSEEKTKLPEVIDTSHLVIETILKKDFDSATNKYNEK